MSDNNMPTSAFAMYSMKRKSIAAPPKSKKLKQKHSSAGVNTTQKKKVVSVQKNSAKVNQASTANARKPVQKKVNEGTKQNGPSLVIKKKKPISKGKNKNVGNNKKAVSKENGSLRALQRPKKEKPLKVQTKQAKKKEMLGKDKLKTRISLRSGDVPHLPLYYVPTQDNSNESPLQTSRSMFEWLIHPLKSEDFFAQNWEKTPVHIKRGRPSYYKFLMSTPLMNKILRESHILFTKNLDITSYINGERQTHNPPGRALPCVVWDYYLNGCSVRMLNPQTYIPKLHALNATLQELFGCFVGANSYLTPPNSQGFAPHYDDIEAFILQVEGKKRWRLYKPCHENEYLARFSSRNFSQSEIGEPILDVVLNAGDLLYFPRGTIHQGETIDDTHSLHITLSVYQRNSWADFLEKLLPDALRRATENDSEFREGLPLDYLRHCGLVHSEDQSTEKERFREKLKDLFKKMIRYMDVDKAADEMAKHHIHDFLPPVLTDAEEQCSAAKDGEVMVANGIVENRVEIDLDTKIRLLRSHCIRLVEYEPYTYRVYYSSENSKEYHEYEPRFLEATPEFVPAIKEIILRYPEFIRVEDLPIEGDDQKVQIAKDLWENCIVVTDEPLPIID